MKSTAGNNLLDHGRNDTIEELKVEPLGKELTQ
jgi:hypothetical protein